MNLLHDPWISVRLESGKSGAIRPWEIVRRDDPPVSIDTGRPDFDGALMQFLIGLLQSSTAPKDDSEWIEKWDEPFREDELRERFLALGEDVFESKRFMQEELPPDSTEWPVSKLLIDFPGENTIKKNTDHFIKRGEVTGLCPICATIALFTLQTNAPSGGRGHRTSLRGGGPLSTLVVAENEQSLWVNLWANVLSKEKFKNGRDGVSDIFPWMGEVRAGEDKKTTRQDASPLQVFWGMPRRVQILRDGKVSGKCDLCGKLSDEIIKKVRTASYGINYVGPWFHPLSPSAKNKQGIRYYIKAKKKIYTDWPDLALSQEGNNARVVGRYLRAYRQWGVPFRLVAFGYQMDKDKALRWVESKFPLFRVENACEVESDARLMIEVSKKCADVLFKRSNLDVKDRFFEKTRERFFSDMKKMQKADVELRDSLRKGWGKFLEKSALELFDFFLPLEEVLSQGNVEKIAKERAGLEKDLKKIIRAKL